MQKIMIVEDDEIIASSIKKHLEKWNYDVFVVNDTMNHYLYYWISLFLTIMAIIGVRK